MKKERLLYEEAKKSKVLLHGAWATMIFFLMIFLGQFIGGSLFIFLGTFFLGVDGAISGLDNISVLLWLSAFPLIPCFFWVKVVEKRKLSSLGLRKEKGVKKFIQGFGVGFLLFSLVTLLMFVFGVISLEQGLNVGLQSLPSILLIIPAWIAQSSTEEILSRGWLMHVVGAKHKPIIGFILSSVVFGIIHIFNPGVNFLSILNIVLVGFLFGLYVIYHQDIWGACGIHAAWNFSQGNIFGFSVSGLEANSTSLLKFSANGTDSLTGGAFGPEASIFTTVILAMGIILIWSKLRTRAQVEQRGPKNQMEDL